jgi:hypothetical protein
MDMRLPDFHLDHTKSSLSPRLVSHFLRQLAATIPARSEGEREEIWLDVCEQFHALQPRDAVEAQYAAHAIAANLAAADCFARAARPGLSDGTAMQLRATAVASGRAAAAALRALARYRPADGDVKGRRPG